VGQEAAEAGESRAKAPGFRALSAGGLENVASNTRSSTAARRDEPREALKRKRAGRAESQLLPF
jgi:hypothetical protein